MTNLEKEQTSCRLTVMSVTRSSMSFLVTEEAATIAISQFNTDNRVTIRIGNGNVYVYNSRHIVYMSKSPDERP